MKILVLGGTVFLGRHFVAAARARGHDLTLFHRGEHNPGLFPDVETIRGNRDGGLDALGTRTWDAVLDTSGYIPRVVQQSAEALRDRVGHYTFISTISVYPDTSAPNDEDSPVGTLEDPTTEEVNETTYGPLKVLCERSVQKALPTKTLVLRPGLIVGRYDPSNRFTYWPDRIARGGDVLVFGPPSRVVQFIDVRDLAEWNVRLIEAQHTGVLNVTGFHPEVTIGDVFDACAAASTSRRSDGESPPATREVREARPVWVTDLFLEAAGIRPWMELPLWIADAPKDRGFYQTSTARARAAGLTYRPLLETARDTLEWISGIPRAERPGIERAGLDSDKERDLLIQWNAASRR